MTAADMALLAVSCVAVVAVGAVGALFAVQAAAERRTEQQEWANKRNNEGDLK